MNAKDELLSHLAACPLVAIIRGVAPDEAEAVGEAIYDAGIRVIEVPLNSPEPLESIRRLAARMAGRAMVGAGTVLDPADIPAIAAAGGRLIVSPNTRVPVIAASLAAGLASSPGYFTPSEAFDALRAGAHVLKLFPAEGASPAMLKSQRAVIPKAVPLLVVGGVEPDSMRPWRDAGADGFGLGSGLYAAGRSAEEAGARARAYVAALGESA